MRVRAEHWQLLLALCENIHELITNKFNGSEEKAAQLNSLGFGEKSVKS